MSTAPRPSTRALQSWPTRRLELLSMPVRKLRIDLALSFHGRAIERVRGELERRGHDWFPPVYLSTGWHCPDRIPAVGVPFALATRELRRLERDVTGEAEDLPLMTRLLRHEVGHAYNYAFRLHQTREWRDLFGPFSRPYREVYAVKPQSRQFVRHLAGHYAQKHPDEDFAETFAVWLTPKARWRRELAGWGCLAKLEYVDRVMAEIVGRRPPRPRRSPLVEPIETLGYTIARHYQRLGFSLDGLGFAEEAVGFLDDDLRQLFPATASARTRRAAGLLRRLRPRIVGDVVDVVGGRGGEADILYDKYVRRSTELGLGAGRASERRLLVAISSMMTSHLLRRRHTGRFAEPPKAVGR